VIKQLDISFIQHSLERIDDDDRRELIPIAVKGCSTDKGQPRAGPFFRIILRLLLDVRIPPRGSKDDEAFRDAIGLSDTTDAEYFAQMIGLFLRLRTPGGSRTWAEANPTFSQDELETVSVDNYDTQKIFQRLSELKVKLVTFLASGAFTDEEKFLPALYAASSFDNRVASIAEEIVKRTSVSLEDGDLVTKLFNAHSMLPAAYRTRILNMLSKSSISATMPDQIMAVVKLDFMSQQDDVGSDEALHPKSSLERTKLHKALFQYLSWVARIGPSTDDFTIGPQLTESMMSYVESQGWPVPEETSHDDIALRSKAYESIGMLSRSARMSIKERVDLATWLFRSLSEDPTNEAVVNIDGALSSLTANIPPSVGIQAPALIQLLLKYMLLPEELPAVRSTRHAVVKWANDCLPFSHTAARWIDVLAIGGLQNERSDVVEQGHKGLDPWTYYSHNEEDIALPSWTDMVTTFFDRLITPETFTDAAQTTESLASHSQGVFQNFQGSKVKAYPVALRYCKQILYLTALDSFKLEPAWMQTLDALVKTDIKTRERLRSFLQDADSTQVTFYLKACLEGAFLEESPIVEECLRCFVEVASLCSRSVMGQLTSSTDNLLGLVKSNKKEIRSLAAKSLGLLAPHPCNDMEEVQNLSKFLATTFETGRASIGQELNAAEGALLATGHLGSRAVYYGHAEPNDTSYPLHLLTDEYVAPSLLETALESFAQLWSAGLAIPENEGEQSLSKIVEKLASMAKKGNEKAIFALGRLAVGFEEPSEPTVTGTELLSNGPLGSMMQALFSLHEIKQVEIHFTVGDAISAAVARWDSDFVKLTLDVEPGSRAFEKKARTSFVSAMLQKLFTDTKATKPSLLKASGIWLFCLVQYCSHLNEVQSQLREAQASFMRLLSARDELVQETASRGLSLVYERGDAELKNALVKDLVSAFTGSGTQLKVDEDTELFDAGALPTGEGNSITSYKDIVNLANEVGDQRLVYKFMSLAANAATWSTRSAFGRFGLSNILSESEVDPKLYPKLFRYRFDPNTNVQKSMDDIWKALVKDTGSVIETHFDAIIDDLLKSILGKEWRVREASCAAIADLLHGRPFPQYEKKYTEVWTAALKVLDDVKGSVREAALRLCMTLSNSLVRQLEEVNNSSAAKAMMKEALPFLLSDKGIESSVKDVQVFATITVMKLAKQGGEALRPFIPHMVPQLLGLLSTIEPEQINYHYQRAGEDSRDQIDKLRSQMVNRSPISEAIENSLRFVNAEVMAELAPKLEATIKSAIGMPTKIGCSRVLTTLFTRHAADIKPVSAKLLKLMEKQTMDKNDEVSQAYARAAAYMMRVVPDTAKERFCQQMISMYFESEDETRRQKISDVIVALAKISPDQFSAHESELLPFAYLGSHDTDEYTCKVFGEVWSQHAGSSRTVVRYVPEIVKLVERCLEATRWSIRHTGAFTVAAMAADVAAASDATGEISETNAKAIWPVLDKTLALKTFPGKEKLLDSYPKFAEKTRSLWGADVHIAAQMKKIAIREAKRNNEEYRVHAFRCLWQFARSRDDLDMLQDIAEIVTPFLDELKDEDKMDVDSQEDLATKTAKNGLEAVARGYSEAQLKKNPRPILGHIMKILRPYLSSPKFRAIKREVWYDCVHKMNDGLRFVPKFDASMAEQQDNGLSLEYLNSLDWDVAETGTEAQRVLRGDAATAIVAARLNDAYGQTVQDVDEITKIIEGSIMPERSLKAQQAIKQAFKYLQRIQKGELTTHR
jgi:proteasome component ECM29